MMGKLVDRTEIYPICAECKWVVPPNPKKGRTDFFCSHAGGRKMVSGEPRPCILLRSDTKKCGPEGVWYSPMAAL